MDWDDIQREFDRVNEMSCKPVGLQKYKVGHIFDENMSVKWNREKLEEENKKYNDEVARLNTEKNKGFCRANDLVYQKIREEVVELIEKEPAVEKEYDVMFSGTEHIDSPGPAPAVGYRIAAKSWEEAVQKGKFYAEMQHPAFIPFAFAGPVIEVPKEELENLETEKK